MFKVGDCVVVRPIREGHIPLQAFGPPDKLLTVSKVEREWVSIKGFPQDGSYTYNTIHFELANFTLENE